MFFIPHDRVGIDFADDEGMTEQSHKDSCDMHLIMRQYAETGLVTHRAQYDGQYMDMASAPDFQAAMDTVAKAASMFESVPSSIRNEFNNDPARFLDFMQDSKNFEKIAEMGLDNSHLPTPVEPAVVVPPLTPPAE